MLLLFQAITSTWHYISPMLPASSFMQVHSRHCYSASCAVETMPMPAINPLWNTPLTLDWHEEMRHIQQYIPHTQYKIQELTCLLQCPAHRFQSRGCYYPRLHRKKKIDCPWVSVNMSSPNYVLDSQGAGCLGGKKIKPSIVGKYFA